ncbi:MAG: hypothetical protein AAF721_00125 [Myxococcota bacterium]
MKISKITLATVLLGLSLSAESHAARPSRGPGKRLQKKARRGAAASGPARFGGRRAHAAGARVLPAAVRGAEPSPASTLPSPTDKPAVGTTPAPTVGPGPSPFGGAAPPSVVTNRYQVIGHKYDSGSPKFRVASVFGAKAVTVLGALFEGNDLAKMEFRYDGGPTPMLSLSCTLSLDASAPASFEVRLGSSKTTIALPAGEHVRILKHKTAMKAGAKTIAIRSKTPGQKWAWHECTIEID